MKTDEIVVVMVAVAMIIMMCIATIILAAKHFLQL